MVRMSEVFQRDLTPLLIDEYFKALAKYPLRQVVWAGEQCITDCLFFPKPAEIIKSMFAGEGAAEPYAGPRQLDESRDPEVRAKHLEEAKALLNATTHRLPKMPVASIRQPGDKPKPPDSRMTEKNWRARWDMAKIHPDLSMLRDAIPKRLRIEFATEDQKNAPTP